MNLKYRIFASVILPTSNSATKECNEQELTQFQRQKEADLSLQVGYRQVLKPGMKKNGYYPINSQALILNSPP